ncbi:MAG: hypothetical protein ACYSUU_11245 [Planctomycetota bacterium]
MQQEMRLYLWKKADLFDPSRGNIEAFVTTAINSWVGMQLRRLERLKRRGEGIEVRGADDRVARESEVAVALIVGHHQHDVRRGGPRGGDRRREGEREGDQAPESTHAPGSDGVDEGDREHRDGRGMLSAVENGRSSAG